MWVPSSQMGGCPVAGFSPWGSCSLQPAPESYALGRDPDALHDAIDDLSPQAQCVLLISIANHLREAVDEGRVSSVVHAQAADLRPYWHCLHFGGMLSRGTAANCGAPGSAKVRAMPRDRCIQCEGEPGIDDEPGPLGTPPSEKLLLLPSLADDLGHAQKTCGLQTC